MSEQTLVERLKKFNAYVFRTETGDGDGSVISEAADRIEELEREQSVCPECSHVRLFANLSTPCPHCRIIELEAIVEELPKTADGVTVYPGMEVWLVHGNGKPSSFPRIVIHVMLSNFTAMCAGDSVSHHSTTYMFYSTRSAAEAAKEMA